jgi:hypothetical protein
MSRCSCTRLCGRSSKRSPRLKGFTKRSNSRWSRCCTAWSARACWWIGNCSRYRARSLRRECWSCKAGSRRGGRRIQRGLAQTIAGDLVRQAGYSGDAQDSDRPAVDRGRCARGTGRIVPLPKLILEYRGVAKLKSTYTDKLPEQINPQPGRIHTSLPSSSRRHRPTVLDRIRICRTFRSAPRRDGAFGRPSSRPRATRWSPPITRKSSCASWRTCRAMRVC